MADEVSPGDRLWHLQERLKEERLFANKEKSEISNLNAEIQLTCEKLYHLSWITRQQWKVVQRMRASKEECSQAVNRLDTARFVDASRHLGYLESKYWEFFRDLRENPYLVASTLAYADKMNLDTSQLILLLLNSLYGNCLLPRDENYVLLLLKTLLELEIAGNEDPEKFLWHHRNSFASLFEILVESLFSTKLYLTAALHAPIMQVLSEDALLQKRLALICTNFVKNLESKLYCFPQSLRWLLCQVYKILSSGDNLNEKDVRSIVGRLLFEFLVCPAIVRPEEFGITSDVQISKIALDNLQQIASCLRCSCVTDGPGQENARPLDLFSRIDPDCIKSFLDAILGEQAEMSVPPMKKTLPGLCRNSVLITENELYALTSFLRMVECKDDHGNIVNRMELKDLLDKLPPPPDPPEDQSPANEMSDIANSPVSKDAMVERSSKASKRKGPFKLKANSSGKQSSSNNPASEVTGRIERRTLPQLNPLAVVNRSEEFKKEFIHRLSQIFQEEEDVLVISLGYSAIECPGMLSEEKVLGIKRPKNEAESSPTFRKRSSSTKFYSKIEQVMKRESEDDSKLSDSGIVDLPTHSGDVGASINDGIPGLSDPLIISGAEHLDLLASTTEDGSRKMDNSKPDVLAVENVVSQEHSTCVDLIDFSTDTTPFGNQGHGNRDSAISTLSSSSARVYSFSSSGSSGTDFPRDTNVAARPHSDIREEDSGFDLIGLGHLHSPDASFRKRSSVITDEEKRRSAISHQGSINGGTIPGSPAVGSNRDSQASFLSFDGDEFPPRSGSSSTADDEREVGQIERKPSRTESLKRCLKGGSKKFKEKGSLDGESDLENWKKKDKGFFTRMRKHKKMSKTNGARVYAKLTEKALETFDISTRLPHPEVKVETTKDVEEIITKYTMKMTSTGGQTQTGESLVDGNEDNDVDDEEAGEEDDDFLDEEGKFENAKRKLRMVLCQADFQNLPLLHPDNRVPKIKPQVKKQNQELMTVLHVQLAEAINLEDRSLSAQLHETIRCIKELSAHSCSKLLDSLERDYKARSPYLAYLVNAHQGLLATHAHLDRLVERVERDKVICRNFFITTCVNLFLESKKGEINAFSQEFQALPIPDEKCDLLEKFLQKLADEIEKHPIWSGASEEQLQDTFVTTERAIMSSIFKFAFYPNGSIDMERDRTFHDHVKALQDVIHPNHKAVRVAKMYRREAPWDSAQKELLKINAYKTPTDKLKCVKRCCATIMNLLCMASETSVPGADEFVPALVYVVIHANPPDLLSTVQYITDFYDQRLSGEEAYYWMQFCAAIAFIKTLAYKST